MSSNSSINKTNQEKKDEEKELTPDERLQWLRDRGVLVETPEERKAGQVANALREADALSGEVSDSLSSVEPITYVHIPADKSKPLQNCTFHPPSLPLAKSMGGDPLSDHLKVKFAADSDKVDIDLLKKNQQINPIHQLGTSTDGAGDLPAVSNETLQKVAQQGHVETFALVHPTSSNKYTGINMYLDEVGQLKRLPLNTRASEYAKLAGYSPPPVFHGDIYMARIHRKGPILEQYLNLSIEECTLHAQWLQQAATDNLEYQMQLNKLTGRHGETQPAIAGSDGIAQSEDEGKYAWTQTEEEVELTVPLFDNSETNIDNLSSKDITVVFKPNKVQVSLKDNNAPLVSINLFERIDVDGCTWTLDKGKKDNKSNVKLIVTMEKVEEALWPRIQD